MCLEAPDCPGRKKPSPTSPVSTSAAWTTTCTSLLQLHTPGRTVSERLPCFYVHARPPPPPTVRLYALLFFLFAASEETVLVSRVVNVNIGDSVLKPAGKDTQRTIFFVPIVSTRPPTCTHACVRRVAPDTLHTHAQICARSCDPPPSFARSGGKVDGEV